MQNPLLNILVALFLSLGTSAQSGFNKYYPSGVGSRGYKVNYLNPNSFVLSSNFVDSITGLAGLDFKSIDNQGLVLNRKRFLFKNLDYLGFAINNTQTDINNTTMMMTGGSYIDTSSAIIFSSVNKNTLDTNWSRYYSDGLYNYYINNSFKVKPNEVWFVGERGNNYGYSVRPIIFKLDTMGNILSIKEFTTLINYGPRRVYFDVVASHLYIAGTNYTNNQVQQSYVACTDTFGNVLWNQQIGANPSISYFYQIEKKNNYLIISGNKWMEKIGNLNFTKLMLLKLNVADGSTVWEKTYADEGYGTFLSAFTINNDESITATGSYHHPETYNGINWNGIIFKAKSNGNGLWLKSYSTYSLNAQEVFFDIQKAPDGGFVMCGAPFFSNERSWVVKTDSLGNGPGVTDVPIDTSSTAIEEFDKVLQVFLYPNPASEFVTIKVNDENQISGKSLKLIIYNATGQIIKREDLNFKYKKASIKTDELLNGIYFIKLENSNSNFSTSKIVIVK